MTTRLGMWTAAVLAGCAPAAATSGARGPAPAGAGVVPGTALRIGVSVDQPSVTIVANGRATVTTAGGQRFGLTRGDRTTVTAADGALQVREWGGSVGSTLEFHPAGSNPTITIDGHVYRGGARVYVSGGGVTAVNVVGVEAYLLSVVGAELGDRPPGDAAAVAAQAVAARTYALKNRGKNGTNGFDLRDDTRDQVYPGVSGETRAAHRAVRATAGRVMTYGGDLIPAFYHSTCGPRTAHPSEVFRTISNVPYLTSVSDARPDGGYFNDISPHFAWQESWSYSELVQTLRETVPAVIGVEAGALDVVTGVYVHRRGPSGRAVDVRIVVADGEIPVFGADIRSVFRTPTGALLRANAVTFSIETADGALDRLTVSGTGFGHGVGLCQWGAIGRARAGHDYQSILQAYYPGVRVERWD